MTDAEDPEHLLRQNQSIRCLGNARHDHEVWERGAITYPWRSACSRENEKAARDCPIAYFGKSRV